MIGKTFINLAIISFLTMTCSACIQMISPSKYSRESVQPVIVKKITDDTISIQYSIPPESMLYSMGVDYQIKNGVMSVSINRCAIKQTCQPMIKASTPADNPWQALVLVPYHQEKVVMIYSDKSEQVYP